MINLAFVQKKKSLLVKVDRHFYVIDAKRFYTTEQLNYTEKGEYGSINRLTVDADDSAVYISSIKQNVYVGHVNNSGKFTLTKTINLTFEGKNSCPLTIGISKHTAFVDLAISN